MKKIYKSKILLFSLMLIFLNGCQNFKDGLSFKKKFSKLNKDLRTKGIEISKKRIKTKVFD